MDDIENRLGHGGKRRRTGSGRGSGSPHVFRQYGTEVPAQQRGTSFVHAVRYYGSSSRAIHARDIIREDGTVEHTQIVLADGEGRAIATLNTIAIDAALQAIVQRDRRLQRPGNATAASGVGEAEVEEPDPFPPPIPLLRTRCTHGPWTIELRELHRWRQPDSVMSPYEISKIEYRTEL